MVAAIARSERRHLPASRLRERSQSPEAELHRARIVVGAGVFTWAAIALAVMTRYGTIASFVLVGWGGSIVVCLAGMFGPFALAELRPTSRDEVAAGDVPEDVERPPDVIDLRDPPQPDLELEERAFASAQVAAPLG